MQENDAGKNKYLPLILGLLIFSLAAFDFSSFFWIKIKSDSSFLAGVLATTENNLETPPTLKLKADASAPNISALAFLSGYFDDNGSSLVLAEKNSNEKVPIASITKLMTAIIAIENYDPNSEITISENIIAELDADSSKKFIAGTKFKASEILRTLLIESNNDAALAFSFLMENGKFVEMMNKKTVEIGMAKTSYTNPVGLDPKTEQEEINYSSSWDLFRLVQYIHKNDPEILNITSLKEHDVYKTDGFNHKAISTNKLLEFSDKLSCGEKAVKIMGGKTGTTDYAKKNLVLLAEAPNGNGYLATIILGANDNFEETKKLIEWTCDSYDWE